MALTCSFCGSPLKSGEIENNIAICPSCKGHNVIMGFSNGIEQDNTVYFYPIDRTIKLFEEQCVQTLSEEAFIPKDIFREINFNKLQCIYIPVWKFSGKYSFNYKYKNGTLPYREHYEYYSTAYKGNKLSQGILQNLTAFECQISVPPEQTTLDEISTKGHPVLLLNHQVSVQQKEFIARMKNIIVAVNEKNNKKLELDSLEITINAINKPMNDVIYIPFFITEFNYQGNIYYFMSDAFSGEIVFKEFPEDKKLKETIKNATPHNTMGCLILVFFIILWLSGKLEFIEFFLLFTITSFISSVINYKKKKKAQKLLEESKNMRKSMRPN